MIIFYTKSFYSDMVCMATIAAAKERPIPRISGITRMNAVLAFLLMDSLASSLGEPHPVHLKQMKRWTNTEMMLQQQQLGGRKRERKVESMRFDDVIILISAQELARIKLSSKLFFSFWWYCITKSPWNVRPIITKAVYIGGFVFFYS